MSVNKLKVVKISGHAFNLPLNINLLKEIAKVIIEFSRSTNTKICVVVGGGKLSRRYIAEARKLSGNNFMLDQIGILVTKINALIFKLALGDEAYLLNDDLTLIPLILSKYNICVTGGLYPGYSTNAVSALISEYLGANTLITMSRAGGIYDRDPKRSKKAKLLKQVKIDQLIKILDVEEKAGFYPLFDRTALNIIKRAKINVLVIPIDPLYLKKALNDEEVGSRIVL